MSTPGALIEVPAKGGRATACNGKQHFKVRPTEPVSVALDESGAGDADQIGHLQRRPSHLALRL